ncbi:leucine-rich repeat-containing protein 20-like [Ostrea edulis]|uniref:leucine-rich repeat-containing protein 20-like n=1 Tax=Ostrea edulis TaxID=37623 RepID=UPI0020941C24|nr:leucine-rich repeat-containing protein 20-like [Ostrea edulis]
MHGLYLGVTQIGYSFTGGLWPGMASGTALVARRLRDAQETRYLDLSGCDLSKVPDAIYVMLKSVPINKCTMAHNMLTKIPSKFPSNFTKLTELDLSKNRLNQFPPDMHVMQDIRVLNLSNNALESVPLFVYSLPNLQELFLQNNCIMDVEVSRLEDIESLSHVNLQNNPISDDLKSQLQSCNFTVLLGNSSVS